MNPAALSAGSTATDTSVLFTGIPLAWTIPVAILLTLANFWAARVFASSLAPHQRVFLVAVRFCSIAVLFLLLAKPVLVVTKLIPIRESLIVLLDTSLSMGIQDVRSTPQDIARAEIAKGTLDPAKGIDQGSSTGSTGGTLSRAGVVEALRTNKTLNFWGRIADKVDLIVYGFSRDASQLRAFSKESDPQGNASDAVRVTEPSGSSTAIGDAIRGTIDTNRGRSLAGILLITDGANNAGLPPSEAALAARADGVPIFAYGIGITKPRDLAVTNLDGPRTGFINERVQYCATIDPGNLSGETIAISLLADGKEVDKQTISITGEGPQEATLAYVPTKTGDTAIAVKVDPLKDEANTENNTLTADLNVLGEKIRVLYIEQSPRWDFRYLLATLQRDRRLDVKAYLFDGDANLDQLPDSPFLSELPTSKEALFANQIIILGDVNPQSLGEERMKLFKQWVGEVAGGFIFLAGPEFNPLAYGQTPLESLLPVTLPANADLAKAKSRYPDLRPLRLTEAGANSRYFRVDAKPDGNRRVWNSFPGVRWTASVGPAKPGAEVIAVDPDPSKTTNSGPAPVIAMQNYGAGQTIFFGTDETYRWRSRIGEKYYIALWGQIIQSLSLHRLEGASQLVQLRADKPRTFVGDTITISGRIYQRNFEPLTTASIPAKVVATESSAGAPPETRDLSLAATPGKAGIYSVEFKPDKPGKYSFSCAQDPEATVEFQVVEPRIEMLESAMNAPLLEAIASSSNGKFLREEDLNAFPELLKERTKTEPRIERIPLFESAWWFAVLVVLFCVEWTFRRLWQLK